MHCIHEYTGLQFFGLLFATDFIVLGQESRHVIRKKILSEILVYINHFNGRDHFCCTCATQVITILTLSFVKKKKKQRKGNTGEECYFSKSKFRS